MSCTVPNVWKGKLDSCPGNSSNCDSDKIGDDPLDGADESHFESAGPPRTDRNKRLGGAPGKVSQQGNNRGHDHRRIAAQKEKRNNGNGGAYGRRQCSGYGGSPRLPEPVFGRVQALLRQRPDKLGFVLGQMLDEPVGLFQRQSANLVAEGKNFSRFGFIILNSFAFAREFRFVNLSLTFCREIRAGTHRESARNHAHHPRDDDKFAVAQSRSGNAGNNSEDGSEAVIDPIDGVADPAGCFWMFLFPGGQKFVKGPFGEFGRRVRKRPPVADEPTQGSVVFALILQRLFQDANAGLVAEFLHLFRVLGDVTAFVQLQPPQRHPNAAYAIGDGVGLAGFRPVVDWVRTRQAANAVSPKLCMVLLSIRQSAECGAP